ncbi:Single Cache domain 2-containing protein [Tistlia consotensis]|uniref:Single Cache domain 2-containing protein n=1 Tax=Tistlia consotensis USBA 355 TaxID=560819 RepID=A0A1Y6CR35_9PROT|nr:cache domain-containing protein [Tistlia consotensis]SMF82312.1 Single Cache domain 2-containing protein [Tistlia consotensis USBA 355]SNS27807.1 Single Cache domain 2-containing protein [Tistlia consotensis]
MARTGGSSTGAGRRDALAALLALLALAGLLLARLPLACAADDRQAVVEMVEAAARALETYGFPRALEHGADGTWARPDAGLYIFVLDRLGTLLLHPDRRMEGRNIAGVRDADGKPFIRDIIVASVAHPGGVWTSYLWRSATSGQLGTKHTYAKAVGDMIVCAGYVAAEA